jgi:hypothetical protein
VYISFIIIVIFGCYNHILKIELRAGKPAVPLH